MSGGTQDLGILMILATQEFVRELHLALDAAGYTDRGRNDGLVFRTLADGPLTVSVLATRLRITKQGMAQVIEDMERRGYVERRPDPGDSRARLVDLSDRGREALAEARRFHRRYETSLARKLGRENVSAARAVLLAMVTGDDTDVEPWLRVSYL